ncbi:MAG TPA: hypothetical protein VG318_03115 [Actinomycetota bacterium]|nr:hypothetical protein [Actinomycetota bacterium]
MRKTATLGAALVLGTVLSIGAAAPASAQPTLTCALAPDLCAAVGRQVQHVQEELAHVPEYVQFVEDTAFFVYDRVGATIRCVVFNECA